MKKFAFMIPMILIFASMYPQSVFANESGQTGEQNNEFNELGIKIGTMVNGEDISELSEWELQYIPEGLRDGSIESEHGEDFENQIMMRTFQSHPNVNNYISSESLPTAKIEYDYKDFFTKFNYRNGFGRVEGIVAHETANNSSTITGEITYMSRNHKNAFVHAFVDHNRIIEIHPLDYGAWGAGRFANQRFVHVELVRVHNFDQFARSINNYSDYIASVLYKYDLGVSSADNNNGNGTLWSHRAVSQYLGGTNHVDPHGYFERWGYNWNEFVSLVTRKYHKLVDEEEKNTSKLGHILNPGVKIYQSLKSNSFFTAGNDYVNTVYYIKKEANISGNTYYLISRNPSIGTGVVGWVSATDISVHNHHGVNRDARTYFAKGTGSAYSKAWGGSKDIVYKSMSDYKNQEFHINLTEKVGNNTWYRGNLNGKTVWLHSNFVTDSMQGPTSKLGHIRNSDVRVYSGLDDNSLSIIAGNINMNTVYYIKREAGINGEKFYLISKEPSSVRGVLGWIKAKDLSIHEHVGVDRNNKAFQIRGTGSAFDKAWGGTKDAVYQNLSNYQNQLFNVHLTEKVGSNTWYRGNLNGKIVWIHSSYVTENRESPTSKLGHIKNSNVKIYSSTNSTSSNITAGKTHTHAVYYIKREAVVSGNKFYLLSNQPSSVSGVVGWVKAEDVSIRSHIGVNRNTSTFTIKGTGSGFSKAWGGSRDLVYTNLSNYRNQKFNVHLTEKVGNNVWYRGNLNGRTIWVHHSQIH